MTTTYTHQVNIYLDDNLNDLVNLFCAPYPLGPSSDGISKSEFLAGLIGAYFHQAEAYKDDRWDLYRLWFPGMGKELSLRVFGKKKKR